MENKQRIFEKIFSIAFVSILLVYVLSLIIINFFGFDQFIDADMYADILLSTYVWKQKALFPHNWVFGNQFYTVQTTTLSALIYGVCGDMYLSMNIATTIMTIIIFACFIWTIKPFLKKRLSIYCGLLLFVSSIIGCEIGKQYEGQLFFLGCSYYACYLITLLLCGGCFTRLAQNIKCNKAVILVSLLLSLLCGMQSLRQTVAMVCPMIACCLFYRNKNSIKYTIGITIFNLLGIILIKIINPMCHTINNNTLLVNPSKWLSRMGSGVDAFEKISGLRWLIKGNVVGLYGLLIIIIFIISIFLYFDKKNNLPNLKPLLAIFVLGILSTIGACTVTSTNLRYIYIFMWFPLIGVSSAYMVDNLKNKLFLLLICISMVLGSVGNFVISYWYEVINSFSREVTCEKQACDYINSHNYDYVYMNWEYMGIMINVNQEIICGGWYGEPFKTVTYINALDIYDEECNEKAIYLVYDFEVEDALSIAKSQGVEFTEVAEFGYGEIHLYESNKQLMYFE